MSKQDGFKEKARETLERERLSVKHNQKWLIEALRAAHNSALDAVLAGIAREQSYREYRVDKVGDQDGSGIGACKEIAGYVKALKSPEGGGV